MHQFTDTSGFSQLGVVNAPYVVPSWGVSNSTGVPQTGLPPVIQPMYIGSVSSWGGANNMNSNATVAVVANSGHNANMSNLCATTLNANQLNASRLKFGGFTPNTNVVVPVSNFHGGMSGLANVPSVSGACFMGPTQNLSGTEVLTPHNAPVANFANISATATPYHQYSQPKYRGGNFGVYNPAPPTISQIPGQHQSNGQGWPKMCVICNLSIAHQVQWNVHCSGKKHLRNLRNQGLPMVNWAGFGHDEDDEQYIAYDEETEWRKCLLCSVIFTSDAMEESHRAGRKHQKSVKLAKQVVAGKIANSTYPGICKLCNVIYNSDEQYQAHINGKQHIRMSTTNNGTDSGSDNQQAPVNDKQGQWKHDQVEQFGQWKQPTNRVVLQNIVPLTANNKMLQNAAVPLTDNSEVFQNIVLLSTDKNRVLQNVVVPVANDKASVDDQWEQWKQEQWEL